MKQRTKLVYGGLAAIWVLLVIWQLGEHNRVRQRERTGLINKARQVSRTASTVLTSQRRFAPQGYWVLKERLESALEALRDDAQVIQVNSILVLNETQEIIASAGDPFDLKLLVANDEYWTPTTVAIANQVELGTNLTAGVQVVADRGQPPISPSGVPGTNEAGGPVVPKTTPTNAPARTTTGLSNGGSPPREGAPPEREPGSRGGRRSGRPANISPETWQAMSPEERQAALRRQGVHSFVIVMSTDFLQQAVRRDLWLRGVIVLLGTVGVVGFGVGYRNLMLSSVLEGRLVRASELNARLKELNVAANGLAHETRTPLNIIRGLAQLLAYRPDAPSEVRVKTREILDEADHVTAQLNEFINYSRPREVRRTAVLLDGVVGEVVRALRRDIEVKFLRVEVQPGLPTISADEPLLRQAIFNLLLNAVEVVERGGEIHVGCEKLAGGEFVLDISDNGSGVPPEQRHDIFKPYFTTNHKGKGLGLAVVHQIVLAHGWEIECLGNEPGGAIFRISHIRG